MNLKTKALAKNRWQAVERDGLKLLLSPALAEEPCLTHAFTTRLGGQSRPPLEWFNLGRHFASEESRREASDNRSKLCRALSLNASRLVVPGQVHSTSIAWISEPESLPDVDGVATVTPDTPILLHFADCVPVIIFEREFKAVCVLHAGWRGTAGGIASRAVDVLKQVLGAKAENMIAGVGPAIGPCCYPVGQDTAGLLRQSVGQPDGLIVEGREPRPDLKAINAMQLLEAGLSAVDVNEMCTACHPDLFYSHRQSGGKTGRQGAIASVHEIN